MGQEMLLCRGGSRERRVVVALRRLRRRLLLVVSRRQINEILAGSATLGLAGLDCAKLFYVGVFFDCGMETRAAGLLLGIGSTS